MDWTEIIEASLKGFIGGGIAVVFTLLFNQFVIPASGIEWALIAVVIGSWFSGFSSSITGNFVCRDDSKDNKQEEFTSLGAVLVVIGVTLYDNLISSAAMVIGGILFFIAAFRESDKEISDYTP